MANDSEKLFVIPLPGGTVARVPHTVLAKYVDETARSCHHREAKQEAERDVVAHHVAVDETGVSDWHVDYELGPCTVNDATGSPVDYYAWHRHPMGTEYAELFEGS